MSHLQPFLDQLRGMHDHICPRQILGVRMGMYGAIRLGLDLPQTNKRVLALVETDGCFADGVAVATGCWMGHRTMRLIDYGKVAVTLVDTVTARAMRLWPHPLARGRAIKYGPPGLDRWHAQVIGYQTMPVDELLCVEDIHLTLSLTQLLSRPGVRVTCECCGEEILNEREVVHAGNILCRSCAGDRYYTAAQPAFVLSAED